MSGPLLRVVDAEVIAGAGDDRTTIVRDVDFEVARGETLGVVGESGSGKSMLMKAVLKLLPRGTSSTGQTWFDGDRIDQLGERQMRPLRGQRISLLLQDPFTMLNPLQTVEATVAESLRPTPRRSRAQTRDEVVRRLAEVGIEASVARKRPFELSGGMRQRVAIAAALAADPDLLVADEPTTALDVRTQAEVLTLLSTLRRQRGMALILITHDLRVAFDVCDRVMVMYAGTVLEEAAAATMRRAPRHPYTAGLMAAEPSIESWSSRLGVLAGSVPTPDSVHAECAFAARCDWVEDECRSSAPALSAHDPHSRTRCLRIEQISSALGPRPASDEAGRPTSPSVDPLLVITGLSKTFHSAHIGAARSSHVALRGVDLTVGEGEAVGLVGESGSGKTTIARSILGLSTADQGRILLGDLDISDFRRLSRQESRQARRLVQVVFQDPYASLNPARTIGRALAEAIGARGTSTDVPREVRAALERVNLPATYADRRPAALSGGERQRVSIARALCLEPRLLICDEPVAALDVSVQAQILELLRSLREELGMAMLFITHDLAVVRQITDRVVVLEGGVAVECGPTDDVLDRPRHRYTRELIAAIPGSGAGVRALPVPDLIQRSGA